MIRIAHRVPLVCLRGGILETFDRGAAVTLAADASVRTLWAIVGFVHFFSNSDKQTGR